MALIPALGRQSPSEFEANMACRASSRIVKATLRNDILKNQNKQKNKPSPCKKPNPTPKQKPNKQQPKNYAWTAVVKSTG